MTSYLILFLVAFAAQCKGAQVTIFEHPRFKGNTFNVTMNYGNRECTNVPSNWIDRISSINTGDLCLELFPEINCGGKKIVVYPSTHHYDLAMWLFDNAAKSLRVCDQVIDDNHLEGRFSVLIRVRNSQPLSSATTAYHMNVFACESVPLGFRYQIQSISTYDTCFRFFSSDNCQGPYMNIPTSVEVSNQYQSTLRSLVSIGRCGYYHQKTTPVLPSSATTIKAPTTTKPETSTERTTTRKDAVKPVASMTTKPTETDIKIPGSARSAAVSKENDSSGSHSGSFHTVAIVSAIVATILILLLIFAAIYKYKKHRLSNFSWHSLKMANSDGF